MRVKPLTWKRSFPRSRKLYVKLFFFSQCLTRYFLLYFKNCELRRQVSALERLKENLRSGVNRKSHGRTRFNDPFWRTCILSFISSRTSISSRQFSSPAFFFDIRNTIKAISKELMDFISNPNFNNEKTSQLKSEKALVFEFVHYMYRFI